MIREVCSCGAEFETDEDDAVALLNDWRTSHRHDAKPAVDLSPTSGMAQVEQVMGFQVSGLSVPVRHEHVDDDDEA